MFCYLRRLHYLCIRFAALGNLKVNFHCTRLQNLCIEKLNKMARRLRKKRSNRRMDYTQLCISLYISIRQEQGGRFAP